MVLKSLLSVCLLASGIHFVSAQTKDLAASPAQSTAVKEAPVTTLDQAPAIPEPLFVFNVDGKTVVVDPEKHKIPVTNLLDGNAINSIEILDSEEAIMRYGEAGKNGCIIVNFKEFATLPEGIKIEDGDGK